MSGDADQNSDVVLFTLLYFFLFSFYLTIKDFRSCRTSTRSSVQPPSAFVLRLLDWLVLKGRAEPSSSHWKLWNWNQSDGEGAIISLLQYSSGTDVFRSSPDAIPFLSFLFFSRIFNHITKPHSPTHRSIMTFALFPSFLLSNNNSKD